MADKKSFGSDHYVHILYIKKFKHEGCKFGDLVTSYYNQENAVYPLFYHWVIAQFFFETSQKSPNKINTFLFLLSYIFFNLFCLIQFGSFTLLDYLKLNIVFSVFPFSYSFWNAKNRGLSPRAFGLLLGQLLTYLLIFYIESPSVFTYLVLFLISFVTLIGSQFSNQFLIFLSIALSIIMGSFVYLLLPLLSLGFFYLLFPALTKSFIRGQFYHKYNYAKYLAPVYILQLRPSIYRDFIYDFWVRLKNFKQDKIKILYYIYTNPLLELIYGFPFLWISLALLINEDSGELATPMWSIILSGLGMFFLTSFRPTRFLGEPQRYVEFVIPLITIVFVQTTNTLTFTSSVMVSFLFIALTQSVFYYFRKEGENKFFPIKNFLSNNLNKNDIIVSNDSNLIKYLLPNYRVIKTDLTRYYKDKNEFLIYSPKSFSIISVNGLLNFIRDYQANILLLNKSLYSDEEFKFLQEKVSLFKIDAKEDYEIYTLGSC